MYTTFNKKVFDPLQQPMFFGESVNVARYDVQKHKIFEQLIEKQLSFFWRPEEVDLTKDRRDWMELPEHEKHIFISNMKYQILLDSIQGRGPNLALLPVVSIPELETWIETWSFSETIHSRSYTHIVRNLFANPDEVFGDITINPEVIKRANAVSAQYDTFINAVYSAISRGESLRDNYDLKKQLYLLIVTINVLEAIRFYVSFACSFAFAERATMEGNAKIIKMIARDEALHLTGTQHIIQLMTHGKDDADYASIAKDCRNDVIAIFKDAADQEKEWADYLFKDGTMIGLNAAILKEYVEYITNQRITALGFEPIFNVRSNPIPWINQWLNSDNVQVAPQEAEISSYLVGAIDSKVDAGEFFDMEL